MGSIGNCCCPCLDVCDGAYNSKTNLELVIPTGLHAQYVSKPIRFLPAGSPVCLVGCPPITYPGDETPVSFATALDLSTCCLNIGITPDETEGFSAPVHDIREFGYDINIHTSGTNTNLCPPFTPLPWQNNIDINVQTSYTIAARRKIKSLKLTICPTVDAYSNRKWTVTADLCFAVLWRTRTSATKTEAFDCWQWFTNYSGGVCIDPTPVKYCKNCCTGTVSVATGTCANGTTTGIYDATPLTDTQAYCGTFTPDPFFFGDTATTYNRTQKRVKTIDRSCSLPDSITFTAADIVGGVGDSSLGWVWSTLLQCWYDSSRVYFGNRSSMLVYDPLTEDWTINLT